ncbi:PREDICTED: putative uncharacterized protein DDB_G0282133 [Ceratosolen solmsi marchali]|uniref:Uncharacterized protein n=1 Tax=Ceratosolen solmsi marchali TaxID=326594 RepID=A0AAJ6YPS1_9HYME|nr:PREDICTED: putative uncharacterized protein DDB_G0282133 [Ceratosolen solmsi marchali]
MFNQTPQHPEMSRKPSKRQLAMSSVTRCSYASRKLPRGSCPLPPLHASLGGLQPVYTIILRSVMGGCEIVDYASRTNTSRAEERLVVDLAMIGRDYPLGQGPDTGNSIFQQQPIIVNADQLASSDTSNAIKSDELSLMETQKLISDNDDSNNDNNHASNNNNNYEYANLIEGMINNVMESTTAIKTMEKENNNNNNENSFEFFNYDSSQIVELATADSSAPVIISLQNFYDPLGASHTTNN